MERGGGRTRAGFLAVGLAAAVLLGGCAQRTAEPASGQIFAMDTIMSMDVYGEGGEEALARAEETIYRLEDLWAVTDENSEIWALNHSGGAWVDLSQETADLLSQALELCALTDGALDLTAYSAVQAWGFTTGEYRVPSQEELDARALTTPGWSWTGTACGPACLRTWSWTWGRWPRGTPGRIWPNSCARRG